MTRGRALLPLLLLLSFPLPTAQALAAQGVAAEGPDADGSFRLLFDVDSASARTVRVALAVVRADADGEARATRDVGARDLAAGTTRLEIPFLPGEGAGRYTVDLVLEGRAEAQLVFDVDDATASRTVSFEVADEPTYLNLTADDVNADGKTKSPGEALLTRARLSDANGAADVDGVVWRVERAGSAVIDGALAWEPGNGTSADIEHRFDRSPFPAGNYTLRLLAHRGGVESASASRTFAIREVAPTFISGELRAVTPDATITERTTVVLADKNGDLSALPEARVYRGSTRVESAGFAVTLGSPSRGEDVDGAGRVSIPLTLEVPARATAGLYRVSLYHAGALLGSMPFDVLPLPTLQSVNVSTVDGALRLDASGAGSGHLVARLTDGAGATSTVGAAFVNGSGALVLEAPSQGGGELTWTLTLHARQGGATLESRNGTWSLPLDGPTLRLTPLHVRARLPATWAVESDWDVSAANASWTFTRWDGAPETRMVGELSGARVRVDAPADMAAGRYTARMRLEWANGSASEATWSFDVGPWVELSLGDPVVSGREARLPIANSGGVAVSRVVVESAPATAVSLRVGDRTLTPTAMGARAQFADVGLAPGESAELLVRLPDGAMRSGRHDVDIRVLAKVALT